MDTLKGRENDLTQKKLEELEEEGELQEIEMSWCFHFYKNLATFFIVLVFILTLYQFFPTFVTTTLGFIFLIVFIVTVAGGLPYFMLLREQPRK